MSEELIANMVSKMQNHVIVMGYKFLGIYVAEKLREVGLEFVVLVRDEAQLPSLYKAGIPAIGSPVARSYSALRLAGVARASSIICTFDDDGDNMLTVLNAKKLNPKIRAITIVNDRDLAEAADASGADVVLAPYEFAGQVLAASTVSRSVAAVFIKGEFKSKQISEFILPEGKPIKVRYSDLNGVAPVVMVSRKGELFTNPPDDLQLKEGDTLYVLTDHSSLVAFQEALGKSGLL
ncbi:MAG: NAD-binding protein [Nitrososphaerota archaeon]|nr:NAD-binding protein [Nitrososphaerota archaeon]